MATVSTIKALRGSVDWDDAWAKRPGSGYGYRWKVTTATGGYAPGVTISDATSLITSATFTNIGTYKATLYVSDGAMVSTASKVFEIKDLGSIEIEVGRDDVTIPVTVTIPTGSPVFQKLDAVLDIDTTGSMGGTINTAKSRAAEIVNSFFVSGRDVMCAVNDHRDFNDSGVGETESGWASKLRCGLSDTLSTVQSALNGMSASGGGDGPECQLYAIYQVCNGLAWRTGSLRVYIQFSDAPAHDPRGGVTSAMARSALTSRNCKFLGVNCGSASYMSALSSATGGTTEMLGSSAVGIVSAIQRLLDEINNNLTVELVTDSAGTSSGLVKKIVAKSCSIGSVSPDKTKFYGQKPGATFTFDVTFSRDGVPPGSGKRTVKFKLLIREHETSAIIDEVPVTITVDLDAA